MNPIQDDTLVPNGDESEVQNEEARQQCLSESAKWRAAARKQYKTRCLECDVDLVGLSRKRFCSQAHQRANWRRRLAKMGPGDVLPPPEEGVR